MSSGALQASPTLSLAMQGRLPCHAMPCIALSPGQDCWAVEGAAMLASRETPAADGGTSRWVSNGPAGSTELTVACAVCPFLLLGLERADEGAAERHKLCMDIATDGIAVVKQAAQNSRWRARCGPPATGIPACG